MSEIGHNRVVADELRKFIERIERLNDERAVLQESIKEVKAEAKSRGYDPKVISKLIALRRRDPEDLAEENSILDLYGSALGMEIFG